ncbi:MAG: PAS domain-containing protein [Desulfatiglandales bacterium]
MEKHPWIKEFPGIITVCDQKGIILEMNDKAVEYFQDRGGKELIGTNLIGCHPEKAVTKLKQVMEKQEKNVYTTERNGVKKIVYQTPWYKDGNYAGFAELILELPDQMPHFVRGG